MNFTRTRLWARLRMVSGILFGLFGIGIIINIISEVGLRAQALTGIFFGACMIGLAIVRVRSGLRAGR